MWRLKFYRGKWCAVRRHGGKTQRASLHTKDRGEAERRLKDHFTAVPKGDLIGQIVLAYIADKKEQGARSTKAMEASWKALAPSFAHMRPDQITRPQCRLYRKARLKGGASDGTVIKDLGVMKAALGWAKMAGSAVFEMPPTPPSRDRYITREEMERLARSAESAHAELFIRLAWATAGRAGALLELTWDRVDFERGQIRLATGEGGRKARAIVPIPDSLRTALEAAYKVRTCDYVIEWGGEPIKSIAKAFRRACERAKLKDVSPHILRHSSAIQMTGAGVDMNKIAQYLGHSDVRVTFRIYARFLPQFLADAKAALE